jgi:hypothetical protein
LCPTTGSCWMPAWPILQVTELKSLGGANGGPYGCQLACPPLAACRLSTCFGPWTRHSVR